VLRARHRCAQELQIQSTTGTVPAHAHCAFCARARALALLDHKCTPRRSFKHKVDELFQYVLGHLLRMRLPPRFASRLLDLHIESSFSMSKTILGTGSLDGSQSAYPLLLEKLRAHAIACFNRAEFTDEARAL
jgi:hypothetical protein